MINLMFGDCLESLKKLPENSVDSIVTDPPYGLSFMGKSWDYEVPKSETWKEALRVLKPGGHLLSFFGTRTYHRGVVNIEDAGFEIRDQIMWIYGSGFPKSHNIGKAIDKQAGAEREVVGISENNRDRSKHNYNSVGDVGSNALITKPKTEDAKQWDGWGTALKPANEDYVVFACWGKHNDDKYLKDMIRGRWSYSETKEMFEAFCAKHPEAVDKYIERKANGPALISDYSEKMVGIKAWPENIDGKANPLSYADKVQRLHLVQPDFAIGEVYINEELGIKDEYEEELLGFSENGSGTGNDDMVDNTSMGLIELKKGGTFFG